MTEKLKEFYELVSAKPELRERLEGLNGTGEAETVAAVIALASELGLTLTESDFAADVVELDDDELGAVAGGAYCLCMSGGIGEGNQGEAKTCPCPLNGLGELYRKGEDGSVTGSVRCWCTTVGNGTDDGSLFPDDWVPRW